MVKTKSLDEAAWNRLRGILQAFLEGKQTQIRVLGSFKNVPLSQFDVLMNRAISMYPNSQ